MNRLHVGHCTISPPKQTSQFTGQETVSMCEYHFQANGHSLCTTFLIYHFAFRSETLNLWNRRDSCFWLLLQERIWQDRDRVQNQDNQASMQAGADWSATSNGGHNPAYLLLVSMILTIASLAEKMLSPCSHERCFYTLAALLLQCDDDNDGDSVFCLGGWVYKSVSL